MANGWMVQEVRVAVGRMGSTRSSLRALVSSADGTGDALGQPPGPLSRSRGLEVRATADSTKLRDMPEQTIGPEQGSLTLHTGVEGRAAKAGHSLTIVLTDWSATVTLQGSDPTAVTLRTALASLAVRSGEGGLKPLSDKDRRTVKASALETLSAAKHPEVAFESTAVSARAEGYDVEGALSLAGVTRALRFSLVVGRAGDVVSVEALVPIVQTEFGIVPYTGLMGGLRVRDRVDVRLAVTVTVAK